MWFLKQHKIHHYSDEELIKYYKDTDNQKYLAELYQRYIELIYGVCLKYFKDPVISKDHSILIYEILREKLLKFEIQSFRGWLYVLVKNHALQILRKKSNGLVELTDPQLMHFMEIEHPINETSDNNYKLFLNNCINQLPEKQKQVIEMFYYQGFSYQDIASRLNTPKEKIRSYIQNGRRNLRICLEKKNEFSRKNI